jgi:hypothetical protein
VSNLYTTWWVHSSQIKTVQSRILLDNYWHWFTMHVPMNLKSYSNSKGPSQQILTKFTVYLLMDCPNVNNPTSTILSVIWGFRRELDENCALLCHYAASSCIILPTFRDQVIPKLRQWITATPCAIKQNNTVLFSSIILSLKPSKIKTSVNEAKK